MFYLVLNKRVVEDSISRESLRNRSVFAKHFEVREKFRVH